MKYKRILLKLSGEALMGDKTNGIDPIKLDNYSKEIKEIYNDGVQIAIVIGGENIRDWIYVEDHCRAILNIFYAGKNGEKYNIGGECEVKNI